MSSVQLDSTIRTTLLRYQKRPANLSALKQLAELYTAKEETDTALFYWDKAAAIQPQNDTIFYKQALLLYNNGRYESSYATVSKSLNLSPQRVDYLSLAAVNALRLHKEDTALEISRKVLSIDERNVNALLLSGIILRDQRKYEDALIHFNHSLQVDPANTDALLRRAEIYVLLKKYNDALRDYSAARADLSNNPDIINNIGICYYQSGSYQKAITFFQKGIFINSRHPQSNFNKGLAHYKLNEFDSASVDMTEASMVWDSCQTDSCRAYLLDAVYYLGMCYKKTGDLPGAKKQFEFLQSEKYAKDLSDEIRHIEYALFISRNWYYIALLFLLLLALLVAAVRTLRSR